MLQEGSILNARTFEEHLRALRALVLALDSITIHSALGLQDPFDNETNDSVSFLAIELLQTLLALESSGNPMPHELRNDILRCARIAHHELTKLRKLAATRPPTVTPWWYAAYFGFIKEHSLDARVQS